MRERIDLAVRPTADQVRRFRSLTASERYAWLASMLETMHSLASADTKAQWRRMKHAQSGGFLSVANTFATALDRAAFDAALGCLTADCSYDSDRGTTLSGPERIIGSYRDNHAWASRTIERVRYRSHVEGIAPGTARIVFEDLLEHRGLSHRYRCAQDVSVGGSRLIERIIHRELEGERPALEAFLARAGIRRDT